MIAEKLCASIFCVIFKLCVQAPILTGEGNGARELGNNIVHIEAERE